ncbi:MAG: hypothetical protein ACK44B_03405 [Flavobacteriales bacterium]
METRDFQVPSNLTLTNQMITDAKLLNTPNKLTGSRNIAAVLIAGAWNTFHTIVSPKIKRNLSKRFVV